MLASSDGDGSTASITKVLMTELHTVWTETKLMSYPLTANTGKYVQDAITPPADLQEFKSHQLHNFGIIKI